MAMKRREFIGLIGGAAAWPLAAQAQQSTIPVVGILYSAPIDGLGDETSAFRAGLAEIGYIDGRNVSFEYRSAVARQSGWEHSDNQDGHFGGRGERMIVAA